MSFFKKLFGVQEKPRTVLDELHSIVIKAFRNLAKNNGTAPTAKTSDTKILEIYSKVLTSFRKASETRGEFISAEILNLIAYKFFQVYETVGEDFMNEHLDYELNLYKNSGLREDYKNGLKLF